MATNVKAWPNAGHISFANPDCENGLRAALVYDDSGKVAFSENFRGFGQLTFLSHTTAVHAAIQFCEGTDYAQIAEVAL